MTDTRHTHLDPPDHDHERPDPFPDPAQQLERDIYLSLVEHLRGYLPRLATDTPEVRARRSRAAIATAASLAPANAIEVRLAALAVAATDHAADSLRGVVECGEDLARANQHRAQVARMGREARGYLGMLLRLQAARARRDAKDDTRESGVWMEHCSLGRMIGALESAPEVAVLPAPPAPAPAEPEPAPAEAAPSPIRIQPREYDEWSDEEKRLDRLRWEADQYAILHTQRTKLIRQLGRLPDICDFKPPEPEILNQIITGNSANLRWADRYVPYVPKT